MPDLKPPPDFPGSNATRPLLWVRAILLLVALLAPLAGAAAWGYAQQKALIRDRVLESLELLAFHKRQAIHAWQARCLHDACAVRGLPPFQGGAPGETRTPGPAREAARRALDAFARSSGFAAAALAGPDGLPLEWSRVGAPEFACTGPAAPGDAEGRASMGPLRSPGGRSCRVEVSVPLPSGPEDGAPSAVLLSLDVRPTLLWEVSMVSAPQGIEGASLILAQRSGGGVDLVIPAQMKRRPPLSVREPASPASLAWRAARGQIERGEGRSCDGGRVLYATQYIPGTGWGLVAQMEEEAAFVALRETRWLAAGVTLLGGLLGLLALYAWWGRRHTHAQEALLTDLRVQKERLAQTVRTLFTAQETERRRLSYDIHDQFIQYLTGARLQLTALRDKWATLSGDEVGRRLAAVHDDLTALGKEARAVVRRIRPPELDALGLDGAVLSLGEQFFPLKIHFDVGPAEAFRALPWAYALALYRTAQEAVANIRKHAGVSSAHLSLNRVGEEIVLSVADFGSGIDLTSLPDAAHFGLRNMAERIELVGGVFLVESRPGGPTLIQARVPIHGGPPVDDP